MKLVTRTFLSSMPVVVVLLGGCLSAVDQRAQDGVHALDACDMQVVGDCV